MLCRADQPNIRVFRVAPGEIQRLRHWIRFAAIFHAFLAIPLVGFLSLFVTLPELPVWQEQGILAKQFVAAILLILSLGYFEFLDRRAQQLTKLEVRIEDDGFLVKDVKTENWVDWSMVRQVAIANKGIECLMLGWECKRGKPEVLAKLNPLLLDEQLVRLIADKTTFTVKNLPVPGSMGSNFLLDVVGVSAIFTGLPCLFLWLPFPGKTDLGQETLFALASLAVATSLLFIGVRLGVQLFAVNSINIERDYVEVSYCSRSVKILYANVSDCSLQVKKGTDSKDIVLRMVLRDFEGQRQEIRLSQRRNQFLMQKFNIIELYQRINLYRDPERSGRI